MLHSVLQALERAVLGRPRAVLAAAVVLAVVAVALGSGIELRTSTRELVPVGDAAQARWDDLMADFHDPDPLIVVLEGASPWSRRTAADAIAAALETHENVAQVYYRVDVDWLLRHALWLADAESLAAAADQFEEVFHSDSPAGAAAAVEISGLADLNDRLAARLEAALAAGAALPGADAAAGAARLRELMELQLRLITTTAATLEELPGSAAELVGRSGGIDASGYLTSIDGHLLMLVTATGLAGGRDDEAAFVASVRALIDEVSVDHPGLATGLTGAAAMTADEIAAIGGDTRRTSLIAILGVSVLATLAFRRRRHALMGLATLAFGVTWALGAVRLELGYLNMITTALVPILVGIGIDYAVHPLAQFEIERSAGHDVPTSIVSAYRCTGRAIVVSAATTSGAFLCFLWMDFRGFSELGLVTGVGVLLCLLAALTVLPALLLWRRVPAGRRGQPALDRVWSRSLAEALCRRPRTVLVATLILSVAAAFGAREVRMRTGLVDLLPLGAESLHYLSVVSDDPNFSAYMNFTSAGNPDQLRGQALRAAQAPEIARFESALRFIPTDPEASRRALTRIAELLQRIRIVERPWQTARTRASVIRLEAALAESADAAFVSGLGNLAGEMEAARGAAEATVVALDGTPGDAAERWASAEVDLRARARAWVEDLQVSASSTEPTLETIPGDLRQRFVTRSGRLLGYIYPAGSIFDAAYLERFNQASARVESQAIGFPVLFERMSGRITSGFGQALLLAATLVFVILLLDLRHLASVLLALLPVGLGTLWLVGLMGALGIDFNLANLVAVPLVLGVGIDNGVHLIHRYRLEGRRSVATVLTHTGRAILIASLTTMIGFGSLALASHRGMASLGLLLFLGVGACLVASIMVLPNLLAYLDRER